MNGAAQFARYGAQHGGQALTARPYSRVAAQAAIRAHFASAPSVGNGLVVVVLVLIVLLGLISQGNGG